MQPFNLLLLASILRYVHHTMLTLLTLCAIWPFENGNRRFVTSELPQQLSLSTDLLSLRF